MPKLGESVTEGTISKWLVQPGDQVQKYDPIAEVLTDKVNAEIPSSFTGIIKDLLVKDGETLPVGEVICTIEVDSTTETHPENQLEESLNQNVKSIEAKNESKNRYSPAVLKMSQEHQIDLNQVTGSGKGGRITRKDLQKIIDSGQMPKLNESKNINNQPSVSIPYQAEATNMPSQGDISIPVSGVRRTIADKMLKSSLEIPHAWMMMEVDVTNLVAFREMKKKEFLKTEGYNLTYFAFFIKAVAQALKEFPMINSTWAGDKIIQKKDINISIAVATEDELFVPVIKNADEKSIKGIAKEITELARKVRSGKIQSEDMQGGTFTINNTGSFGSIQSMGIINYPQAAILQVESIVKKPIVINNMIAIRDMVNLCISLDHRVLDGLICGKFLQRVKEILESTSLENTKIY